MVISAYWAQIEPSEGSYSASATTALQGQISAAISAGLQPVLDLGSQYPPSWIFNVGGGTQFVDQYGDVYTDSPGSGNDVANAVTDKNVQVQLGDYIAYLGSHLTGLTAVRLGGGPYNELKYPDTTGTYVNAYWFYDESSQATLPSDVRGWIPGTGTEAQAATFINAYNAALVAFGVWLVETSAAAFPSSVRLELLLPSWGQRAGDVATAIDHLLVGTNDSLNLGLDWIDLLPLLTGFPQVVAYSTWADSTNGGVGNPDPAAFIHSILPSGMAEGGESTGNGNTTTAGEALMLQDAQNWGWYSVVWAFTGQPQTPAQVGLAWLSA